MTPPVDTPPEAQKRKGSGYPWASWDCIHLPMRNDVEFRRVAAQVAKRGATDKQRSKYGVRGLSMLSRLSSVDFPRSFPPDSMHLWFENIIPNLVKHWRGKYRVEVLDKDAGFEADDESSGADEPPAKRHRARQKKVVDKNAKGPNKKAVGKVKEPKVISTDDPYNIKALHWETKSREIAASASSFPLLFGPLLRNFLEHIHEMTAAEWQLFTFLLAPVYLKDLLPNEDYEEFISLVEGVQLSCDHSLEEGDFLEMEQRMVQFSRYYERRYYRMEWARLKSCLPVFHQILHVTQGLRWAGPMYVYSQWAMGRFCGSLAGMAKSRVATNRNISNNLLMLEHKNTLRYVIDHGLPDSASDEDSDGNIRLANFLTKRLRKSRPPDAGRGLTSKVDKIVFCGPSKARALTAYERTCLKSFFLEERVRVEARYLDESDLIAEADSFGIPTHCRTYRSAGYDTCKRGDLYPFKSTSSTARRSNQSRSTSLVRFESRSSDQGSNESCYGEILFYFTIDLPHECVYAHHQVAPTGVENTSLQLQMKERGPIRERVNNEILFVYVRQFEVFRDGRLLYCEGKGVRRVILANNVHELIGLLKKGKREYIVRLYTALF